MAARFPKSEKLKSKKSIEALFDEGKSITSFPVKLYYMPLPEAPASQVAFSVPKRNFKLATNRNRVKRQLRECYRLHKHSLLEHPQAPFALLFLYISKDKPQYAQLESSVRDLLAKLNERKD